VSSPRTPDEDSAGPARARGAARLDKAALAKVFGDVLPETSADERDPGSAGSTEDDWLRAQVPPHHG